MADTGADGFMRVGLPITPAKADVNENGEQIQQIDSSTLPSGDPFTLITQVIASFGLHVDIQRDKNIAPGLVIVSFSGKFDN